MLPFPLVGNFSRDEWMSTFYPIFSRHLNSKCRKIVALSKYSVLNLFFYNLLALIDSNTDHILVVGFWQVVSQMREIVNKDSQNATSSNSFLLDDDLR